MKARKIDSGITSVLIDPWRKEFMSACDHVGACSMSIWSAEKTG